MAIAVCCCYISSASMCMFERIGFVIIGDFFFQKLEIVCMKKNVAIYCRARIAMQRSRHSNYYYKYTQQRLCFAHRGYATVNGRRSQASAEKVPVRAAGREKSGALKYKTRTQKYLGTHIPGTRHIARSFREVGLDEMSVGDPDHFLPSRIFCWTPVVNV